MFRVFSLLIAVSIAVSGAQALDRKPLDAVNIDALLGETQVMPAENGVAHTTLFWWLPSEYWEAIFSQDDTINEQDAEEIIALLQDVFLLAVVQADISRFGAFEFYPREEILQHLEVHFYSGEGADSALQAVDSIDPDLSLVLGMLKPVLAASIGEMGNNMHFLVLEPEPGESERKADPYGAGRIELRAKRRDGQQLQANIELPLDSLHVPRMCPNGKPAHVSWKFCPWSGERLK